MARPLNNARLLPFGLYDGWTPSFAALFDESGRHWPAFFAAVRRLADLPPEARNKELERLRDIANASKVKG